MTRGRSAQNTSSDCGRRLHKKARARQASPGLILWPKVDAQGMRRSSARSAKLGAEADQRQAKSLRRAAAIGRWRRGRLSRRSTGATDVRSRTSRGSHHRRRGTAAARSYWSAARRRRRTDVDMATAAMVTAMVTAMMPTAFAAAGIDDRTTAGADFATAAAVAVPAPQQAGLSLVFTAHKGDADNRDHNRDAKNQCTIHPRILQTGTLA